jgi:hypothetical protein
MVKWQRMTWKGLEPMCKDLWSIGKLSWMVQGGDCGEVDG